MLSDEDLAPLRARVSKLEGQLRFLYEKLNIEFGPETLLPDDPKVVELIKKGKKIEAITMYRQITRAGLAEAKNAVEEIQGRLGLQYKNWTVQPSNFYIPDFFASFQ